MNIIPIQVATTVDHSASLPDPHQQFIEQLGRALHRFGLPSHRIEDALTALAGALNHDAQFFATPTAIFMSFDHNGAQRTALLRLDPGAINLDKLARLDAVRKGVLAGEVSPADGAAAIDSIVGDRNRHGPTRVAAGFILASASASVFFGGGLRELAVCTSVGILIGLLSIVAGRFTGFRLFESTGALLAGFAAAVASALLPPVSVFVATFGGVIALVPGLSLTTAINELATRNLAAGTVRLASALLVFLQIGFGIAVGLELGVLLVGRVVAADTVPLPDWTLPLALALSAIAFTILFQANPRDIGWIGLAGLIAFAGARLGSTLDGPELGAFLGALTVGLCSNLHARLLDRSATLMLVPGIMLIVPGSLGFRSISSMLEQDIVGGIEFAFTMVMTGVALVTGLLIANGVIAPRHSV